MSQTKVGVRAIGAYLPGTTLTNEQLESEFETTAQWIETFIGVRERRRAQSHESSAYMSAAAVRDACEQAGIDPADLDLVICGTYTPDRMLPATAVIIMSLLGIEGVPGFDINSGGCPAGVFTLDVGATYVRSAAYRNVAVVVSDTSSWVLDPRDRTTQVIFGDGAACYLLQSLADTSAPSVGIMPALLRSLPTLWDTAFVDREPRFHDSRPLKSGFGDNFSVINGRAVREFALGVVPGFTKEVVGSCGLDLSDIDLFVFHQANLRLVEGIIEALGIPPERTASCAEQYGNTSGAGVPLSLRAAQDAGRLSDGDRVALVSFGSGLSLGGVCLEWAGADRFTAGS